MYALFIDRPVEGVFFPESFQGMPTEEFTIAEMLKMKNYKTGLIGKWTTYLKKTNLVKITQWISDQKKKNCQIEMLQIATYKYNASSW